MDYHCLDREGAPYFFYISVLFFHLMSKCIHKFQNNNFLPKQVFIIGAISGYFICFVFITNCLGKYLNFECMSVYTYCIFPGAQLGGTLGALTPPLNTKAKNIALNRGATHFQLGLSPCIISSFLL